MKPEMSLRSRIESAASCNQLPSMISSSFATSSADRSSPITSLRKPRASSRVKDGSGRIELSYLAWRAALRGAEAVRTRPDMTECTLPGRRSSMKRRSCGRWNR